jgi:hypothetical protein
MKISIEVTRNQKNKISTPESFRNVSQEERKKYFVVVAMLQLLTLAIVITAHIW